MQKKPAHRTHQVRIIGGAWKRTPLPVQDAVDLRPTPDRVRETVFNWINHLIDGAWGIRHCLDLYAGTGALGFEAASRGAPAVTMVDALPAIIHQLDAVKTKLNATQVTIIRGDAERVAQNMIARGQRFDLIFLDPPYQQDNALHRALLLCERMLNQGGLVYAEAASALSDETLAKSGAWEVIRADRAGLVHYHLLQRKNG